MTSSAWMRTARSSRASTCSATSWATSPPSTIPSMSPATPTAAASPSVTCSATSSPRPKRPRAKPLTPLRPPPPCGCSIPARKALFGEPFSLFLPKRPCHAAVWVSGGVLHLENVLFWKLCSGEATRPFKKAHFPSRSRPLLGQLEGYSEKTPGQRPMKSLDIEMRAENHPLQSGICAFPETPIWKMCFSERMTRAHAEFNPKKHIFQTRTPLPANPELSSGRTT